MTLFYDLFRHASEIVTVKDGDFLFREGDRGNELMYVMIAGEADILVGDKLVEKASAGTILGEMAVIEPDELRAASVLAKSDCQFVEINPKRFNYLVTEAPHFALEIMRVLTRRLRNTDRILRS